MYQLSASYPKWQNVHVPANRFHPTQICLLITLSMLNKGAACWVAKKIKKRIYLEPVLKSKREKMQAGKFDSAK